MEIAAVGAWKMRRNRGKIVHVFSEIATVVEMAQISVSKLIQIRIGVQSNSKFDLGIPGIQSNVFRNLDVEAAVSGNCPRNRCGNLDHVSRRMQLLSAGRGEGTAGFLDVFRVVGHQLKRPSLRERSRERSAVDESRLRNPDLPCFLSVY